MTEWDGRPENSDRDGAHALDAAPGADGRRVRFVALWAYGRWHCGQAETKPSEAAAYGWQYVGPCLTPAEIEQRERAARAAALEEAAALIECGCKNRHDVVMQRPNSAARWSLCEHPNCMMIEAAAIRALGKEAEG